jgi:hypothetical protein
MNRTYFAAHLGPTNYYELVWNSFQKRSSWLKIFFFLSWLKILFFLINWIAFWSKKWSCVVICKLAVQILKVYNKYTCTIYLFFPKSKKSHRSFFALMKKSKCHNFAPCVLLTYG